ncbi:MAG: response regulator [Deltaproteobacteria bacterium HGW-Deltaproteobacteria-23]|jgi:DNA-binding response OmpR family regulator|nr:MAG: response regulator [Deltaproteobacteria bacterium HGW-Deltaproteobacteria-23]
MLQQPTTVLLIDDDAFFLKLLGEAFSGSGFTVFTAADGNAGVKAFIDNKPEVVICDLIMPGMGGVSTCMTIRKIAGGNEPIIALLTSMFKGPPRMLESAEMGAKIHIPKSTHPLSVVVLVEQLLHRRDRGSANVS